MANKNYVKALRRAKAKKTFYSSIVAFVPIGIMLFILNVGFVARDIPWSMIPISVFVILLVVQRLMLAKKPQKSIFSNDYLEYQTEKELRLIEFEDDMDELEAEKLQLPQLDLHSLSRSDNELV